MSTPAPGFRAVPDEFVGRHRGPEGLRGHLRAWRSGRARTGWPRREPRARVNLRELLVALAVAVVTAAVGAPVGLLWRTLAPQVVIVKVDGGAYPLDPEPEGYFADDGWFLLIGAVAGVVLAVAAWILLRRYRGPLVIAGLVVGSVAGAMLAAWLGHRIGLAEYQRLLRDAPAGTRLHRPVSVRIGDVGLHQGVPLARGLLLMQAFAAAAAYTLLAAFNPWPSLRAADDYGQLADAIGSGPISSDWMEQPTRPAESESPEPGPAAPPPDAAVRVRRGDD